MGVRMDRDQRQRGQGLVEFSLILPILLALLVGVAELGLIFGKVSSLGYASREGARVGSALALGDDSLCGADQDPSDVDASLVAAVQRILKSPDSGIDPAKVQEIRIFKATSSGAETPGRVNIWRYAGPGGGPEVDPGPGQIYIDFAPALVVWPACSRTNGASPDSIGVTVRYTYDFVTPLPVVLDALSGGALSLTLSETTVMALNPTY
jgi:hypothetical protein